MDAVFIGELVTVLFIIMAYSYLIKSNVLFQFVQSTYVGLGVGHSIVMTIKYFRESTMPSITAGNLLLLLPLVAGLLLFGRLKRDYLYLYRYPLAILIGVGLGLQLRGMFKANLIDQITSTMNITVEPTLNGINSILILIFVITSMSYFFFTARGSLNTSTTRGKLLDGVMKVGQYVLMGAFGAGFAASFIGRLAVFMDVLNTLITFFSKLI